MKKPAKAIEESLPAIIADYSSVLVISPSDDEEALIAEAGDLFNDEYYGHALINFWNAAVHNLRRRVESYSTDLFLSVAKDEPGRKKYDYGGETIQERWEGVDDLTLVNCATKLGLLNKIAGKTLETVNWMRNHASPAHHSDNPVKREDVIGLALLLQKNLFECPFPDPGHSVSALFEPVKSGTLDATNLPVLKDQVKALRVPDIKVAFGFLLDLICAGEKPGHENGRQLFPEVWKRASTEVRKLAGLRYHKLYVDKDSDKSKDKDAKTRLLEVLVDVEGVELIPDASRAGLYRQAAKKLAVAKDTSYGWTVEESAAKTLVQLGTKVPSIAFEEVYQEILAVWCGNYWGRSQGHSILADFIEELGTTELRRVVHMFLANERVREELGQTKPAARAKNLLIEIREKFTIEAHKAEVDEAIKSVEAA